MTAQEIKLPTDEVKAARDFRSTASKLRIKKDKEIRNSIKLELQDKGETELAAHRAAFYEQDNDRRFGILNEDELNLYFPEIVALAAADDEEFTCKFSKHRVNADNLSWKGNYNVFTLYVGDEYIRFEIQAWSGCCASAILSCMQAGGGFVQDKELREALAKGIVPFLRSNQCVHQLVFSYSDEEVPFQDSVWKEWGGYDIGEPFVSFKTGHMIHNGNLILADAADYASAAEQRRSQLELEEEYDGDFEEPVLTDDEEIEFFGEDLGE